MVCLHVKRLGALSHQGEASTLLVRERTMRYSPTWAAAGHGTGWLLYWGTIPLERIVDAWDMRAEPPVPLDWRQADAVQ